MASASKRRWVLFVVLLAAFTTNLTLTILTIALVPIAEHFAASVSDAAWITLAPIVVTAVLTPAAGRAADRFGRKRVWMSGFVVSILGIAASGVAPSLGALIAARVVTGAGVAAVTPAGLALATAAWPPAKRGLPIGWWTSTVALSPALGVIVGGFVVDYLSWRWLFYLQLPLALIALVLAARMLRDEPATSSAPFDGLGAVLGAALVFALLFGVNRGPAWGWSSPAVLACGLVFFVSVPLFVVAERRAAEPVVPLELLTDPPMRSALAARALASAVYMGSFMILPVLLMEVGGWAPAAVALALAPRPAAMALVGPFVGRFSTRVDPARLATAGGLLLTFALTGLALYSPASSYLWLLAALILKGAALACTHTGTATIVTARAPDAELGTVSGMLAITTSVANALGMALLLSLLGAFGGEAESSAYQWSFGIGAAGAALATLTAARLCRASVTR